MEKILLSNLNENKECHGVIFLIDGSDKEKINETISCLRDVLKNEDLDGVPFLICVNK